MSKRLSQSRPRVPTTSFAFSAGVTNIAGNEPKVDQLWPLFWLFNSEIVPLPSAPVYPPSGASTAHNVPGDWATAKTGPRVLSEVVQWAPSSVESSTLPRQEGGG